MEKNEVLMPINEKFIDVFEVFMDANQRTKIRANNVRQYTEGIVDLILKDKILATLKPSEIYEGINWGRKIKILQENYDVQIANSIQEIFRIGGDGSHFNGIVNDDDLQRIIDKAIHIVEDIFVKYFLEPEHKFGSENIFTIFSMLPLNHRIYILENVSKHYMNLPDGAYLVWLIFLCSWGCDTCAYCVGMLIGKHKMSPILSPKKSVEGAVGGVVGAALLCAVYAAVVGKYLQAENQVVMYAVICAVGALISMVGDLAASAIKRNH